MKRMFEIFKYREFLAGFFMIFVLAFSSCTTDLDPLNNRVDELEKEIFQIQSEISKLKSAWQNAKVIEDVKYISAEDVLRLPQAPLLQSRRSHFQTGSMYRAA